MAWYKEDTKPLPESVVIQDNGAYTSLPDWLSWLLHRIGKIYPRGEKRYCLSTRGMLSPPYLKMGNSDPSGWSGRGTGWPYFVKSPLVIRQPVALGGAARPWWRVPSQDQERSQFTYEKDKITYEYHPKFILSINRLASNNGAKSFLYFNMSASNNDLSSNNFSSYMYATRPHPQSIFFLTKFFIQVGRAKMSVILQTLRNWY